MFVVKTMLEVRERTSRDVCLASWHEPIQEKYRFVILQESSSFESEGKRERERETLCSVMLQSSESLTVVVEDSRVMFPCSRTPGEFNGSSRLTSKRMARLKLEKQESINHINPGD